MRCRRFAPAVPAGLVCVVLAAAAYGIPTSGAQQLDVSDGPAAGATGLAMYKVTIPRGNTLDRHYHPGTQVGWVIQGRLHYSVVTGTAHETVPRSGRSARKVRPVTAR